MSGIDRVFRSFLPDDTVEVDAVGGRELDEIVLLEKFMTGGKCRPLSLERRRACGDPDGSEAFERVFLSSTSAAEAAGGADSSRWLARNESANNRLHRAVSSDLIRYMDRPCWFTKPIMAYGERTVGPTPAFWSYLSLISRATVPDEVSMYEPSGAARMSTLPCSAPRKVCKVPFSSNKSESWKVVWTSLGGDVGDKKPVSVSGNFSVDAREGPSARSMDSMMGMLCAGETSADSGRE